MIKMLLSEVAKITGNPAPTKDLTIQGISTDTRTLQKDNLFVAIRGEQYDGHDFLEQAMKKGASAVLVDRPISLPIPQITVEDTLLSFGKIAEKWRAQFSLPIIGVTGSNGKTTLKNMIASILKAACHDDATKVLATEGNLNNNIGLPMMLARFDKNHQYAVLEMGMNHFGEIEYLTGLTRPQVAVINNAAESHLEGLKDVAGVARAKGEIFSGLPQDGIAILNRDDQYFDYWHDLVSDHTFLTFGLKHPADVSATFSETGTFIKTPKGDITVTLPLLGMHNVMNALAATAATLALGIDLQFIKKGLESVRPAHSRMEQYVLKNGARVIDDTYNANPFSLQAAVNTLAKFSGEKVLVLGDMKELGENTKLLHKECGEKIRAAGIDYLFTFGELSAETSKAFGKNAEHFTDRDQLVTALQPHLKKDKTILVKGSRSMRMEKILAQIVPKEQREHAH